MPAQATVRGRLALPTVTVAAGICFSADGRRMYFADGARPCVLQCEYDAETAGVSGVRAFADAGALPEGAAMDRDGNLWSAQAGAGRLVQYAPDGRVLQRFLLPWGGPASPAFGGSGLAQLMVSSEQGLFTVPDSGAAGIGDALFDDG